MTHLESLYNCPSSAFASSGIPASTCNSTNSRSWIIDRGAMDHIAGFHTLFSSNSTSSSKDKVRIADGSLLTITDGSILWTSSVLHAPKFSQKIVISR